MQTTVSPTKEKKIFPVDSYIFYVLPVFADDGSPTETMQRFNRDAR